MALTPRTRVPSASRELARSVGRVRARYSGTRFFGGAERIAYPSLTTASLREQVGPPARSRLSSWTNSRRRRHPRSRTRNRLRKRARSHLQRVQILVVQSVCLRSVAGDACSLAQSRSADLSTVLAHAWRAQIRTICQSDPCFNTWGDYDLSVLQGGARVHPDPSEEARRGTHGAQHVRVRFRVSNCPAPPTREP